MTPSQSRLVGLYSKRNRQMEDIKNTGSPLIEYYPIYFLDKIETTDYETEYFKSENDELNNIIIDKGSYF
jgi:hypothetical protein